MKKPKTLAAMVVELIAVIPGGIKRSCHAVRIAIEQCEAEISRRSSTMSASGKRASHATLPQSEIDRIRAATGTTRAIAKNTGHSEKTVAKYRRASGKRKQLC